MEKEVLLKKIKEAGVVGAGGAGFPTHIKLNNSAEFFIINIAECEPLLKVDQQLAYRFAKEIVDTALIIKKMINAKMVYLAIKKKYKDAIETLTKLTSNLTEIKLFILTMYILQVMNRI